ncbi:MAG: YraN family protein [Arcobacteraceae bacterium]|nr:YraN family protein [Arcobacteraceae bacterium]
MSRSKGDYFEDKAVEFLSLNGYLIVERNFYAKKLGEIDIVTTKNGVYHFIEVKSGETFEAVYNITPSKLRKLLRSVEYYLKVKKLDVSYCIDAMIYAGEELEYLENITL